MHTIGVVENVWVSHANSSPSMHPVHAIKLLERVAGMEGMLLQALHVLQQVHSDHLKVLVFMTFAVLPAHSNTIHCLIRLFMIRHIGTSRSLTSPSIPLCPSTRPTTSHWIPRTKLKAAHLADSLINIHPVIVIVLFVV